MQALANSLLELYKKDLNRLYKEIESYVDEGSIWTVKEAIPNSAGNLCLHLVGNLNTFIGATLGNTGYVRNRELEFSQKDLPRTQLLQMIADTTVMIEKVLPTLSDADWQKEYPIVLFEKPTSTLSMIVYMASHLSYHLGQVNYHRRLLDNTAKDGQK